MTTPRPDPGPICALTSLRHPEVSPPWAAHVAGTTQPMPVSLPARVAVVDPAHVQLGQHERQVHDEHVRAFAAAFRRPAGCPVAIVLRDVPLPPTGRSCEPRHHAASMRGPPPPSKWLATGSTTAALGWIPERPSRWRRTQLRRTHPRLAFSGWTDHSGGSSAPGSSSRSASSGVDCNAPAEWCTGAYTACRRLARRPRWSRCAGAGGDHDRSAVSISWSKSSWLSVGPIWTRPRRPSRRRNLSVSGCAARPVSSPGGIDATTGLAGMKALRSRSKAPRQWC